MSEIFLKLVNMSITASWLVLAVVILRFVFKKAPKFIHCIMWALVGIRLVFPFSIESVLSIIPSANTFPVENIYSPDQNIANNSYYHGVDSGVGFIDNALNPITHDVSSPEVLRSNLDIISIVWIVGIAAMLVYTLISYMRIYKRVSASICVKENTFICDDIDTPFILGVFRPRIYLPSSMSESDAEYVVAHEKAHLKRLDHLWKPLGFLILAVYWFNPVLWLAYFLLCRDIEFACDQKVIRELGIEIKKPYSDALINCSVPRKMLAACPLAFGETSVKSRIKSVLSFKKPAVWIIIASVLAVSIAAVCLLTNPKKLSPTDELLKYNLDPAEMVYCYTAGSFTQTPPMYSVTSDMFLQEIGNYDSVYTLGSMKELKLNSKNFNSKFEDDGWTDGYSAEFIRSNNKNAWQVNTEYATYILLEQKDGTYYITKLSSKSLDINTVYRLDMIKKEDSNNNGGNVSSGISGSEENVNASFNATVLEVYENYVVVEPFKDQNISSLPIEASTNVISQIPVPDLKVGSKIQIVYNGEILETYPEKIQNVFAIYLIGAGSVDVPYKISYANYTTKSWIYTSALNTSKMYQDSQKHLPIYKFESRDELEQFKASAAGSLSIDKSYDNIQSLNDATAEYGAEFFKNNALILTYISSNSSTWRYGVKELYNDGKNFQLTIMRSDNSESGDSAMCGWYVTVEVKKADIKNCTSFDAVCNDIDSGLSLPEQETTSKVPLSSSGITKIAVKSEFYPNYAREITSAKTIDSLISMLKELETITEHKHPMRQTGGDTVLFSFYYQGGKTETIEVFADRYIRLNDEDWLYITKGNFSAVKRLAFDIPRITPAEKYSEIVDKNITSIHVLEKSNGVGSDANYSVTKTYTDENLKMLKSYLNTNYCEYRDVGEWIKKVAAWPDKYAVALTLDDNTSRIITVHFDEYDTMYCFAIGKSDKPFEVGNKDADYLEEYSYDRYAASAQFGDYLLSLL